MASTSKPNYPGDFRFPHINPKASSNTIFCGNIVHSSGGKFFSIGQLDNTPMLNGYLSDYRPEHSFQRPNPDRKLQVIIQWNDSLHPHYTFKRSYDCDQYQLILQNDCDISKNDRFICRIMEDFQNGHWTLTAYETQFYQRKPPNQSQTRIINMGVRCHCTNNKCMAKYYGLPWRRQKWYYGQKPVQGYQFNSKYY